MGLTTDRFAQHVDEEFICPICQDVLEQPVSLRSCEHNFCRDCILDHVRKSKKCPVCRALTREQDVQPINRSLNNLMRKHKIHCQFRARGCQIVETLETIGIHEGACDFLPSWCPNEGCPHFATEQDKADKDKSQPINRKELDAHLLTCVARSVTCEFGCGAVFKANERDSHNELCDHVLVKCENGCDAFLTRKGMSHHILDECLSSVICCEVKGCEFSAVRGDVATWEVHERDAAVTHTRLINKQLNQTIKRLNETTSQLNELRSRLTHAGSIVWTVESISEKRISSFSHKNEVTFTNQDASHRYTFLFKIRFTEKIMGLYSGIQRGPCPESLEWPCNHRVEVRVLNQRGNSDAIRVIGEGHDEPAEDSRVKCRGWSDMFAGSEIDDFVVKDRMVIVLTLLDSLDDEQEEEEDSTE
eukprot:c7431_g1_i1.p1 GENE.c7431_g1_i1~~c7431_g1_i1.p1  ORF type:complete len:417 (+),score=86.81 c7431_g1_i1:73-1323(+)